MDIRNTRLLAGTSLAALLGALSAGAAASTPPPATATIDRPVLDVFGVATVSRCDMDNFQKSVDPNYQEGHAFNKKNVDNRREWAGPSLTANAWKRLDYYVDSVSGAVLKREYPNRLYPTFAYDRSGSNPGGSLDERYPPFYPSDTEVNRVTPEMRTQNPGVYTANQTFVAQKLPDGAIFLTGCREGCLTGWQKVEYVSGETSLEDAVETTKRDLVTVGEDATPEHLTFSSNYAESYSKDVYAVEQNIITLHTEGGGVLELTPRHPLLTGEGDVKVAEDMKVGDELVRADGSHDRLAAIETSRKKVQVYNVAPRTLSQKTNLLIVEGYLVGSQRLQDEVNAIEAREMLRDFIFPEDTAI